MANDGNQLNYVDYDFQNLVTQLQQRLRSESQAWKDTGESATGQMLIELWSYVGNMVLYYMERRAEESYLETAKLRSSIINLVRLLNYVPRRKTSAAGILTFSIPTPILKNIYIPKWTECQVADGTKFVTTEDVVILYGGTTVDANAIQGYKVETEITSDGSSLQERALPYTDIENENLFVYVNNELWTKVSSFLASTATSKEYRLRSELDGTVTVLFGNGVRGKIPPAGQIEKFVFLRSVGVLGNAYSAGSITTINSTLYDEDSVQVSNVSVTNADAFLGGSDEETTEEIRVYAPLVFRTGDRAVTKDDYVAILEAYSGVANANVWGEAEESAPNYDLFNKVKLTVILEGWILPGTTFKQTLATYLQTKAQLTVKYEFQDPTILEVIPVVDVKVLRNYTLSLVQSAVTDALGEEFVLGSTTRLGTSKRVADLIAAVENVAGVSYSHLTLDIRKELPTPFDSYFDYGTTLDALPVKTTSVKIYDGSTLVAVDNGSGGFTNLVSGITVTGSVDYITGYLGVNISPTPAGSVFVRYQQEAQGDIVVSANQICKLLSVDITSIGYV